MLPAPVPETQHTLDTKDMEVMRSSEFQDAAENALSLIMKIISKIPAVHKSLIYTKVRSRVRSLCYVVTLQHLSARALSVYTDT